MMALEYDKRQCDAAGHWIGDAGDMPAHYSAARASKSVSVRIEAIQALVLSRDRVAGSFSWEALEAARHGIPWRRVAQQASQVVADDVPQTRLPAKLTASLTQVRRFDLSKLALGVGRSLTKRPAVPRSTRSSAPSIVLPPAPVLPMITSGFPFLVVDHSGRRANEERRGVEGWLELLVCASPL